MSRRLILVAALAALALPAHGATATRHDLLPLHIGSSGPRVLEIKYLLRDPRPKQNVFRAVKGTFTGPLTGPGAGYLGKTAGGAIYAYKFRLGYPATYNSKLRPVAGPFFFGLLAGTAHRPASWVALAAKRLAAVEPGATKTALAAKAYALKLLSLNIVESPLGSNRGRRISYGYGGIPAIQSSTGAYGAAWCVSTVQAIFKAIGYGTFADRTAGVFYAVRWAANRSLLHAKPKLGAVVAFMDGQGHMGIVVKVLASGFVSIEGNASNRVLERFHTFGDRRPVYLYLRGVA